MFPCCCSRPLLFATLALTMTTLLWTQSELVPASCRHASSRLAGGSAAAKVASDLRAKRNSAERRTRRAVVVTDVTDVTDTHVNRAARVGSLERHDDTNPNTATPKGNASATRGFDFQTNPPNVSHNQKNVSDAPAVGSNDVRLRQGDTGALPAADNATEAAAREALYWFNTRANPRYPVTVRYGNSEVSCTRLYNSDKEELLNAQSLMPLAKAAVLTDEAHAQLAENCAEFLANHDFRLTATSEEEAGYPIAYAVRLHKSVWQFVKLLRALYQPQHVFCVTVDQAASAAVHRAVQRVTRCLGPRVFLSTFNETYIYGGFSPVAADLACMRQVRRHNWEYFVNLPGTEYPLKTNLETVRLLKALNGSNDIENVPMDENHQNRVKYVHEIDEDNRVYRRTEKLKKPLKNTKLYKGSSYNLFSRAFVLWALRNSRVKRIVNWLKDTDSPDETLWATVNRLPDAPGGYPVMVTQVSKTTLSREVIWAWDASFCHSGVYVHSICMLSVGDLYWLSFRWEIFANKFDASVDPIVLDCLEASHRNRTAHAQPDTHINWEVVDRLPHIIYRRTGQYYDAG